MSKDTPAMEFVALNEAFLKTAPEPGSKYLPDWMRDAPSNVGDTPYASVKKCPGIFDAATMGYVARSPCDIQIMSDVEKKEMTYRAAHGRNDDFLSTHNLQTFTEHYPFLDEVWPMSLKIDSKFLVRAPDGYSLAFVPLYHTPQYRYVCAIYGVADTFGMGYPRHLLINMFVRKFTGTFMINRGDPLCLLVPFRTERFTHSSRAATDEEIKKFESFQEEMGLEFQHNSLKTHRHKKQYA